VSALRRVAFVVSMAVLLPVLGVLVLADYLERFGWWMVTGNDPEGCTWTWQSILVLSYIPDYVRTGQWRAL
jgi:hypothetical protein